MKWINLFIPITFFLVCLVYVSSIVFIDKNSQSIELDIVPNIENYVPSTVKNYNIQINVQSKSVLTINNASLTELFKYDWNKNRLMDSIFLLVVSFCFLVCVYYNTRYNLYKKDLTPFIMLAGTMFICEYFLNRFQADWAKNLIPVITQNEYKANFSKYSVSYLSSWVGFIIIWLGRIYKQAYKLNKQQELTI